MHAALPFFALNQAFFAHVLQHMLQRIAHMLIRQTALHIAGVGRAQRRIGG